MSKLLLKINLSSDSSWNGVPCTAQVFPSRPIVAGTTCEALNRLSGCVCYARALILIIIGPSYCSSNCNLIIVGWRPKSWWFWLGRGHVHHVWLWIFQTGWFEMGQTALQTVGSGELHDAKIRRTWYNYVPIIIDCARQWANCKCFIVVTIPIS